MRALQVEGKVRQKKLMLYAFCAPEMLIFFFFISFESFLCDIRFFLAPCLRIRKDEFA
jgi:hypothetical protein